MKLTYEDILFDTKIFSNSIARSLWRGLIHRVVASDENHHHTLLVSQFMFEEEMSPFYISGQLNLLKIFYPGKGLIDALISK